MRNEKYSAVVVLIVIFFVARFVHAAGTIVPLDVPGATNTYARAVVGNKIVGAYQDANGAFHGFLYNGSQFTTIDVPNASFTDISGFDGTNVVGISSLGGYLWNGATFTMLTQGIPVNIRGGVVAGRTSAGGYFWDGLTTSNFGNLGNKLVVMSNDGKNAVGYYYTSSSGRPEHGYLWNGTAYTLLDYPQAVETQANDISGANVVGEWTDGTVGHGFIWNGQTYQLLEPVGAIASAATCIDGNNVAGFFRDSSGSHGFHWDGAQFSVFDPDIPGSSQFGVEAISGNTVVGSYMTTPGGTSHIFVFTVPEPGTGGLTIAISAIVLITRRRRAVMAAFA